MTQLMFLSGSPQDVDIDSGAAGSDSLEKFVSVKLSHHKDLLSACALAGQHLESAGHWNGHTQLQS